ncbi:epidermal growth factor receptor kinase substrate 8-like protein 1 isoform X1 [Danio rerio]|uniref:Epidermal growth factor receptor kinase substrate 8-like protein 1 isoform X1 n=3 Tax=Danio rerio TaxID=7955 RepID=A0A8M2BI52_DANRE|nr:epidermal growth factor receptor kinase substrate 8-like protein 1 isoform X1 [Danio rerio]|eukprot:XP_005170855.1 epidermal growth factor receptor kinase substrate 8-like protein 1 isoform X1 [Danio rerio]
MGIISQYLLTKLVSLSLGDDGVDTVEEALSWISLLIDSNRVSRAEVLLEVRTNRVILRDTNYQELEELSVSSLLRCECINTPSLHPHLHPHPALLLLVSQSCTQKKPSVYFFTCESIKAERIRDDIKRAVSHYTIPSSRNSESSMDISEIPSPPYTQAPNPPASHPPPPYPGIRANGLVNGQPDKSFLKAQMEVDILNHCFDDIEAFIGKLQQSAEAQIILDQRSKKKKKNQKKSADEDLLTAKAKPPSEREFIDTFQKFKYCLGLLARLKPAISNPSAEELVHHVFKPLDMMVKATGGPGFAASVSSPAMTEGAVNLLKNNLTTQENALWLSLGPNWTHQRSALRSPVAPYTLQFQDGWKPQGSDAAGWIDPIESEHKHDAEIAKVELTPAPASERHASPVQTSDQPDGSVNGRIFRCSYDFVARNNSELSVLQGETLEAIESSKRWWKCRNKFDEVGFVPFNILEPITHIDNPVQNRTPKPPAAPPMYNTLPSSSAVSSEPGAARPRSMIIPSGPEDTDKVMQVNDELLQRLTSGKNLSPRLVIHRSADTSAPLDYNSPPAEVENWLRKKGFSEPTVQCLRVLNGAQLFSLNKEELRAVIPEEGARVYSQLTVQRAQIEDAHRASELETVMEKQKMKVDLKMESGTL